MSELPSLLTLLIPLCETISERRALLREALGARSPLLGVIDYECSGYEFIERTLATLAPDPHALDALLDVAKDRVSLDVADEIETLRSASMHAQQLERIP